MCLDCGCGKVHDNHGNNLHILRGKFKSIADLNGRTMSQTVAIIYGTLMGLITEEKPLGDDKMEMRLERIKVKPEMKANYVSRRRTKATPKES